MWQELTTDSVDGVIRATAAGDCRVHRPEE